ncbi:MAG TPA: hybrid sensor histidine kinase/response regulator, partial [Verrucomicrobiae bacterium]
MENLYEYKKFAVLYVDDEEKSLTNFTRAFSDEFRLFTASNAQDGLKILEQHPDEIAILMTDQRMPGEKGVWLLERARQLRPRVLRMLVTAFADMDAAIAAVNSGAIYKYITKPWDPPQLEMTLRQGLEFFMVQSERDELLHEKMSVLRNMMIADRIVSLGLLAAGLSHHIRNSMVAVKTFLELAPMKMAEEKDTASGLRDPDFWRDYHQNVQGQIEKINNLLADLRSASEDNKNSEPFADEIQLKSALALRLEALREPFAARRIVVENQIPDSLPPMRVDRPKFDRLFDLLLKDELAMLPAGSQITLTAEVQGREMVIRLADNGPALPTAALQVVLDPFTVTSGVPSEYGINLMACFFIAHHHGGKIEAQSRPGGNL